MANIDNFQYILNNNEQGGKKIAANVLIITSVEDQEKILSCLTPTNTDAVVVNLNNQNITDTHSSDKKIYKRFLPQLV
jgi:hypothetical protein